MYEANVPPQIISYQNRNPECHEHVRTSDPGRVNGRSPPNTPENSYADGHA